jgi:hypothetical protein
MNIVGDRLAAIAATEDDPVRFDLFGRSAFNRYYYSAYFTVRTALGRIDTNWERMNHKAIPQLLRTAVLERLRKQASANKKTGLMTGAEASRFYSMAASAAAELSNCLRTAYEVRVVADYEPQTKVEVIGKAAGAKLADCTISRASGWQRRAETHASTILRAYERFGLI